MITLQENISLKNFNTFHIDVKARFFVEIKSEDAFVELMQSDIWNQYPHFFLWWGANILFTQDFEGIVIKNSLMGKHIIKEDDASVLVKIWSGEWWPAFVNRCVGQWYQWLEKMALIPWTIWWSAVGNIGAYGAEAKDVIYEVEYIDIENAQRKILTNTECKFAYRESVFKHDLKEKVFITSVIFALQKVKDTAPLKQAVAEIVAQRQAKLPDPAQVGTAWSFFKNPIITPQAFGILKEKYPELISFPVTTTDTPAGDYVKLAAGQLIELCGLKWYTMWNVGVSSQHALVLINLGNGTGEEMLALAHHVLSEVKKNFWITLDPEVIII